MEKNHLNIEKHVKAVTRRQQIKEKKVLKKKHATSDNSTYSNKSKKPKKLTMKINVSIYKNCF